MSRCATPPNTPSPLPFHCPSPLPTFRNLGPEQLAGVIFTCTEDSLDNCLRAGVFGLPRTHFHTRELHGIFRAITGGKIDAEPQGVNPDWASNFPAQVDVDTSDTYPPLPETAFRRIIAENYISSTSAQFSFELDMDQVARLSEAFKQFSVKRSTPVPNVIPANNFSQFPNQATGPRAGFSVWENRPSTEWLSSKSRRLSPVERRSIQDLLKYGRPKSSMEHLTGHTSHFDTDISMIGGGGQPRLDLTSSLGTSNQLQSSRLSLDVQSLQQLSNFSTLFGNVPTAGGIGSSNSHGNLLSSSDMNVAAQHALANPRLVQDSTWRIDDSVASLHGMMTGAGSGHLNGSASSQLFSQTQMGLGLNANPAAVAAAAAANSHTLKGRFSSGNLSPIDTSESWTTDPAIHAFQLAAQNLSTDIQISQAAAPNISPEERQQSRIWQVNSKDMGLVPDTQKLWGAGAFTFPEKAGTGFLDPTAIPTTTTTTIGAGGGGNLGALTQQPQLGSYAESFELPSNRYQETWGGPNPAMWKPPRPHSSAEGEGVDAFGRGIQGMNTMYPDAKAQLQEVSDESDICHLKSTSRASGGKGLKTKSRNNDESEALSDGGSPSESAGSVTDQVNIGALEEESRELQRERQNDAVAYQTTDLFLEKNTIDKNTIFGFSPGDTYNHQHSPADELIAKRNISLANTLNGVQSLATGTGLGVGAPLPPSIQNAAGDFSELLNQEPSLVLPSIHGALDLGSGSTAPHLALNSGSGSGVGVGQVDAAGTTGAAMVTGSLTATTTAGVLSSFESEMLSTLVLENEKLRAECAQLQKQVAAAKKKQIEYGSMSNTSNTSGGANSTSNASSSLLHEGGILTDFVFLGGLFHSKDVKVMNPDQPETLKKIELASNFCRGASVSVGNHVFILGGTPTNVEFTQAKPSNGLYRIDIMSEDTDNMKTLASMKTGRCLFGGISAGNKIFAIGGNTELGPTETIEIYDPITDSWVDGPHLSSAKHSLGTAVVNNVIYAVGGQSEKGVLQTVERLDPREGRWMQIGSLSWSRAGLACCPVFNHLFAAGGHNGRSVLSSGEILDLRKGIVNESLTLIEPRQYGSALPFANQVYLIGGLQSTTTTVLDADNTNSHGNSKFSRPEVFSTMLNNSVLFPTHEHDDDLLMVYHSACSMLRTLY